MNVSNRYLNKIKYFEDEKKKKDLEKRRIVE